MVVYVQVWTLERAGLHLRLFFFLILVSRIAWLPLLLKHKQMSNLTYISPFFIVSNIKDSVSFYVNKLGFEVRFIGPEDGPFFAIVGCEGVSIMLKAIIKDIKPVPNHTRHEWAAWDAYISTADPDALFEEYNSAGVAFRQPIRDDDDGLRGFEVTDADGYVLFFGRPKA
jgi:catechol 2,3-dioxygenase-like lactoylglutathione lyase family enzyme